ncbi:16089_t:CDS:2, partial [Gigaspora rosea]
MNSQKPIVSLEDVLNDYYPLAGTLKNAPDGRTIIDCNDCGVQFIIAECSDITINQLENKKWEHAVIPQALTCFWFLYFYEKLGRRARLEHIDPPIHDRSLLKTS